MKKEKKFKRIYIEITNCCNLKCSFCPQTLRQKEFMTIDKFEYILKQIQPLTNNIYLHLMGEPLLHPKLEKILSLAEQYNLNVNITTNGILLSESLKTLISHKIRKLSISLHSYEANKITTELTTYLNDIFTVSKKLSKKGTIVEFKLWNNSSKNIQSKNELNNQIISSIENYYKTILNIKDTQHNYTISDNTFLSLENTFIWPIKTENLSSHIERKKFCFALRTHFGILVDGTVVPCCLDSEGKLKLGNIFKTDINTILNSQLAQEIYNGFSNRLAIEPICLTCQHIHRS